MKKVLIIVDVQVDFVDGSLAVPNAANIIPIINNIDKSKFDFVILTADNHPANHIAFASQHKDKKPFDIIEVHKKDKVLWPDHCVEGTYGARFHPDLSLDIDKLYIFKKGENSQYHPYSAFGEIAEENTISLADFLKENGIESTFICGLATDFCVKDTAIDSSKEGFSTFVIWNACKGIADDLTPIAIELIDAGVTLIDSTDLK